MKTHPSPACANHRRRSAGRILATAALLIAGSSVQADWKTEADARIETLRKRDVTLTVRDAAGQAVSGATVQVRQRRRDFAFGCALNNSPLITQPRYADFFARNFEWAVFENEAKWTDNEPTQGNVTYARADIMAAFCRKNGITMRGHTLFWEATGGGYEQPTWLPALANPALQSAVEARLNSAVPHFLGCFEHWDINNEMLHGNYFRSRLGASIVPFMFQRTRVLDPWAKRFVNDYNVVASNETAAYVTQIQNLLATGAAVEGIGAQGHFGGQIIDPALVLARLNTLGAFNLPIWISEYDSVQADATNRADNLEKLYRVAFSHSAVKGILMWGFWANAHWLGANAAIVDANWTVNAAGQRYLSLLAEWITNTSGTTNGSGQFTFRGFHGDYDITISAAGQTTVTRSLAVPFGASTQNSAVSFGLLPELPLVGEVFGDAGKLAWERTVPTASWQVDTSTDLSGWTAVSPNLDPLAKGWTHRFPAGNLRRFYRVRSTTMVPPDFDFSEAVGAQKTVSINASGLASTANTGVLHTTYFTFTAPDLRDGSFTITEDANELSPNGGPNGALRFRWEVRPTTVGADFWGFMVRPRKVGEWPDSPTALTATDLGKTRLRFRHKLTTGRAINVRVEPDNAGFNERCDFGNFTGTGAWQEFSALISVGGNQASFLASLNGTGERYVRVIFGNGAGIGSYASGDTLFVDDVSLHWEP